ncbi:MAG: signal peptide peptidase SppA [Treponemataceae bacterium]|nr:signal peptide peptidase SppA [Treponemataceae bacterium]
MDKNKKSGLIVLIVIIAITILSGILHIARASNNCTNPRSNDSKETIVQTRKNGYIAALYIEGVISEANSTYNQDWILNTIARLKKDKRNKGIALFLDTPGGAVYETDEVYLALQDYKTTDRPVYAYQAAIAASGGYYISCAANKIYANRNTLTGSIGIICGTSIDITGLMESIGIKSNTFHSGRNKTMLSYNEPLTNEQREIMQSISDECYEQFTGIVSSCRNIPIDKVKQIADGRIYTAKQALSNGLIDVIDSWENMISEMEDTFFEGKSLEVIDFKYENSTFLQGIIGDRLFGKGIRTPIDTIISKTTMRYPAFLYE